MSTTGLKLGSLAIRTLAKPIASRIRAQARDHPRFRRLCINIAQQIHRVDMRLRLGILRDSAAIEKADQAEREWYKKEAAKRSKEREAKRPTATSNIPPNLPLPPRSVVHHVTGGEAAAARAGKELSKKPPRIRPLSENKAIENGANFISEFFLFSVAGGLILLEQIRSRRKEASRRDMVADRLEGLEERNLVDEERFKRLEEQTRESEDRVLKLEEENWKLKGGKGKFPGRKISEDKRVAEEKMLAERPIPVKFVKEKGFWSWIWGLGKEKVEEDIREPPGSTLEATARQAPAKDDRDEKPGVLFLSQIISTNPTKK
ncbi:unnamed protein product [Tuber melanosporum]|uniref:(Perigord truffle) hypothetical protein n=1 Tax=Tuber melanosporum (strain Mel28) TaxID=656061 RepID=D5GID6_TUBMM|nr:uncharacterized protein GSTUM_00008437001 [Tuber melanosporum]CAZ84279.1 unnamed protein product [Tuber melanosporum]